MIESERAVFDRVPGEADGDPAAGSDNTVAVVICTKDRPETLRRAVCSVLRSSSRFDELLIIDQSAESRSEQLVRRFARLDSRVQYVRRPAEGVSAARNFALRASRSELLLYTDDDCRVARDWVGTMTAAMQRDGTAAVGFGQVVPASYDHREGFIVGYQFTSPRRLIGRLAKRLDGGIGANMALRRSAVLEFGGFDTCLGPGAYFDSCEDGDIAYRALKHGAAVLHVPESRVTHYGLRTWSEGRALVRTTFSGVSAAYFKYVRCGDPVGILLLLQQFGFALRECGLQVARRRRPVGVGRLLALVSGIRRSFELPVDHATMRYGRPTPAPVEETMAEPIRPLSIHRLSTAAVQDGPSGLRVLAQPVGDGDDEEPPYKRHVGTR